MEKLEMEELLKKWNATYRDGAPVVSDDVYDAIEDLYISRYGSADISFIREAQKDLSDYRKVKHTYPMNSMPKVYDTNIDEAIKYLNKKDNEIIIEPKFDGLSLGITYINGSFVSCLTKYDRNIGIDISEKIKTYFERNCPSLIKLNEDNANYFIRCEFIIPEEYNELFKDNGYNVLRNAAAGLLRKKSYTPLTDLGKIIATTIRPIGSIGNDRNLLKELWKTLCPEMLIAPSLNKDDIDIEDKTIILDGMTFQIDGYVYKTKRATWKVKSNGMPEDEIAIKSTSRVNAVSEILDIEWNMSFGKLIPTYLLKPTEIDGTINKRSAGGNYDLIKKLKDTLKHGNVITLVKSGDIIPYVNEIVDYGNGEPVIKEFPTHCPECGCELKEEGVHLVCTSSKCPSILLYKTMRLIKVLGVQDIGEKIVKKLIDAKLFTTPAGLLNITEESFNNIDGLGSNLYNKTITELKEKIKNMTWEDILYVMAIPEHSSRTLKKIKAWIGKALTPDNILEYRDLLISKKGYTETKYDKFLLGINNNIQLINELVELANPKEDIDVIINDVKYKVIATQKPTSGETKAEWFNNFNIAEVQQVSSVTDANILVCADKSKDTGKLKKARKKNLPIYTYDEFLKIYNEHRG